MPNIIQALKDAQAEKDTAKIINTLLPKLFQAEEDGLIIELPCQVGDEIYFNDGESVQKGIVTDFDVTANDITPITGWSCGEAYFRYEYSLTCESAEKRLEENKNGN